MPVFHRLSNSVEKCEEDKELEEAFKSPTFWILGIRKASDLLKFKGEDEECILRSVTDVDAFQSGRFAKQNGRPETQKFLLTLSV
jgi:hypothetical protein